MSSSMPVIFLTLWTPSETWTFFESLSGVKQIVEKGEVVGLMIPYEVMGMQNPIVENFRKKSLDTFAGLYSHVICWKVSNIPPGAPF